jgi:hypothetical protein
MFPATISPVQPKSPNTNDLWYDTNADAWLRWDGAQWVTATGIIGPEGPPGADGRSVNVTQSEIEPPPDFTEVGDFWIKP